MNSWIKVASGARLVASAVAKQTAEEAAVAAQRATHHGLDLSSRARQTVASSQQELWKNYAPMKNDANNNDGLSSSQQVLREQHGPNPYESQLRKKQEKQAQEKNNAASSVNNDASSEPSILPNPFLLHAETPTSSSSSKVSREWKAPAGEKDSNPSRIVMEEAKSSSLSSSLDIASDSATTTIWTRPQEEEEEEEQTTSRMQEGRAVPSSRVGRAAGFASLGLGLAWGTISEVAGRLVGKSNTNSGTTRGGNPISSDANADRLAATLCRMRGAALKMGQMLSIQDESLLPPALTRALNQVRQGADAMPNYQLVQQMESQLGKDWREKFESFDELPL